MATAAEGPAAPAMVTFADELAAAAVAAAQIEKEWSKAPVEIQKADTSDHREADRRYRKKVC